MLPISVLRVKLYDPVSDGDVKSANGKAGKDLELGGKNRSKKTTQILFISLHATIVDYDNNKVVQHRL